MVSFTEYTYVAIYMVEEHRAEPCEDGKRCYPINLICSHSEVLECSYTASNLRVCDPDVVAGNNNL